MANPYEPGADIFAGRHAFICGATQQGKTYFVRKRLEAVKRPVLFFNPQDEPVNKSWIRAGSDADAALLIRALKQGAKINYVPDLDNQRAAVELDVLTQALFKSGFSKERAVLLAVDECHLAKAHKRGDAAVELAATRGIRYGINCVFITQRPAYAHKAAYTQADLHVMFRTNMERGYLSAKGIPFESYSGIIQRGGQYSYAVFDGLEMQGPYKE